jgi:glycosyltransferase involved in cell wall biosynthesis
MPLLSIAMPTVDRPELFEHALGSVMRAAESVANAVEVVVSDGSADDRTGRVVERLLHGWPGGYRYTWNRPRLEASANFNRAMGLASGEWIQQLHDDDYLLPNACTVILDAIRSTRAGERVLLFGVEIVDVSGSRMRTQTFSRNAYLSPPVALKRLLCNSSFVRLPAVVVHRGALEEVGLFDTHVGTATTDLDMWLRLFSRYGVRCIPHTSCAYRIHEETLTSRTWNPTTLRLALEVFDRAVAQNVVPERNIRRWQTDFLHQWILAGCYRQLRAGRRAEARNVLRLFRLPEVRKLGLSPKWLPVRAAFAAATAGSPPVQPGWNVPS